MTSKIEIYPVTKNDIAHVANAESEIFSDAWSENALSEQFGKTQSWFYAINIGTHFAGYLIGDFIFGELQIYRIAILPDYRRKGCAHILLQYIIEQVRRQNGFLLTLEVRVSNEPAIALYRSCGFKNIGTRKNFYSHPTEDAFIMNMEIKEEK